jgi:hypothetical protein
MNEQRTYEAPGVTRRSTVDPTLVGVLASSPGPWAPSH